MPIAKTGSRMLGILQEICPSVQQVRRVRSSAGDHTHIIVDHELDRDARRELERAIGPEPPAAPKTKRDK